MMSAFYLNICSCLTKLSLKKDAVFAADEGLKVLKGLAGVEEEREKGKVIGNENDSQNDKQNQNQNQNDDHSHSQNINAGISKGHYKKAQAYLQYINRDEQDIKLGFYELKLAYDCARDD